jgi:UDP-3-O-[3-hydroxymyristoyl] glucosamine N-acyltransferase
MADPRFFERRGPFSLGELAGTVGGRLDAGPDLQPDRRIRDVAALALAGPGEAGSPGGTRMAAGIYRYAVVTARAPIGAIAAIGRGAAGDTAIGTGSIIDNLVQIAHKVTLGRGCTIVARAGISGRTTLEDRSSREGRRA